LARRPSHDAEREMPVNELHFYDPGFWAAVLEIILINILLSGDNAVVIALACRTLPPRERLWGMIIGAGVASVLLILFTALAAFLLGLPYLRLVGAIALVWIAARLVAPEGDGDAGRVESSDKLWRAVRIVVVADVIMSLDNVVAVAAAAKGNYWLLGLGLSVSIPIVIAGSAIIMWVLERLPLLIWAGAILLGWIAGDLLATDLGLANLLGPPTMEWLGIVAGPAGAVMVLTLALLWRRRPAAEV
jgi:YjbE family integral membrane protein